LYLVMNLMLLGYFPCLDFSGFIHAITNKYMVLNQKVLFLLQLFEGKVHISDRLTGLVCHGK